MPKDSFATLLGSTDGKNVYWATDKNAEIPIKYNPGS